MIAQKRGLYILTMVDLYEIRKNFLKAPVEVLVNNNHPHLNILDQLYHAGSPCEPAIPDYDRNHDFGFQVNKNQACRSVICRRRMALGWEMPFK